MGKKTKRTKYVSKGGAPSVSKNTLKAMRRDREYIDVIESKITAWTRSKKAMITIENPNKNETNKRFIRVPVNDNRAFGEYRKYTVPMKQVAND